MALGKIWKLNTTRKFHQTKDSVVVICVYVVHRKQQDSCEREEQMLIEAWREGYVTGKPTMVEISVDGYDNNYITLFSVNNHP